jgi:hypothetical protein
VAIFLYFPVSIFIGLAMGHANARIGNLWQPLQMVVPVVITLVAVSAAATWQPRLLRPEQFFVTPADEVAAAWIESHIEPEAVFAVRPYFSNPIEVAGVDGGYWLPYLTGRQVTIPPMIYYADGDPAYVQRTIEFLRQWRSMTSMDDFVRLLRSHNVDYVYIGPQNPDSRRDILVAAPQFEVIYDESGVTILHLRQRGI